VRQLCIPFAQIPQTTNLFETFLTDPDRLSSYYSHPPTEEGIAAAAGEVNLSGESRRQLVEVLRDENARLAPGGKLDATAERNLDRLAKGAVAIVTGQQVGLFSGPALTIYKALSAIRCAEETTCRGMDAVPVFWLATEDHDLAEVNESFWKTRHGLDRYELPADPVNEGHSVGQIPLGNAVVEAVSKAAQTLDGAVAAEISNALRESYTPKDTFGSGFGKLLARIFAGRGLLLIDPQDVRLKRMTASICRAAIEHTDELRESLFKRSHELEESGYHAQVKVTQESTLLFCSAEGKREPLRSREKGGFHVGETTLTKEQLLATLEKNPETFTASALLRPVLQDTILPTAAYIGGPAEIAYLAQSQVVYKKLLGRMPAILARASFTLVEAPITRFLDQYGLDVRDVFRGKQHLRAQMEQKTLPDELTKKFAADEEAVKKMMASYQAPLERLDATLLGSVETAEEKIISVFQKLKEKVGRAENFRTGVLDRHERILLDSLYANHELQERHLSALPHLAAHGLALLDEILRVMPPPGSSDSSCSGQHHVIFLD
jgi:bacillithiol biosynthesis cysteine-adding enzyme BshC